MGRRSRYSKLLDSARALLAVFAAVAGSLLLVPLSASNDLDVVRGPGASLVSWTVNGDTLSGASKQSIVSRAAAICQFSADVLENVEVQAITYEDAHPLGESRDSIAAWLLRAPGVLVRHPTQDRELRLDLNVVIVQGSQKLLAVFTDAKEEWVLPDRIADDLQDLLMDIYHGNITPSQEDPQTSVSDVLGEVWRFGNDLLGAGQVILRPRIVLSTMPPTRKDGDWVPNEAPRLYWIAHVAGTVAWVNEGPRPAHISSYASAMAILLADDDLRVFMGHHML